MLFDLTRLGNIIMRFDIAEATPKSSETQFSTNNTMVAKRKDSVSGVSTDDPTDKSEGTESHFLQPTRHDVIPLVLAVLSIILGLTSGLTSYFLLRNNEYELARTTLKLSLDDVTHQMSLASDSLTNLLVSSAAFFQVSKTPITLFDQFAPFVLANGSPKFFTQVSFAQYIAVEDTDRFVASIKQLGGPYANMTVASIDAMNQRVPIKTSGPTRCIITQTVPTTILTNALGFDACTESVRNATLIKALNTGELTLSSQLTSIFRPNTVSVNLAMPVNSTINHGVVVATVTFSDFIESTFATLLNGYEVTFYDMNTTEQDKFLYTTHGEINTTETSQHNAEFIALAPFTYSTYFTLADRVYRIEIIPYSTYLRKFNSSPKYIALIVSLVIMMALLIICAFIYFGRKLFRAKKRREEANIQIDLLKTNQSALRTLLDRIATQESKTRAVINSLTDCICVITPTGKIVQTNSAFDETFPFTQQEMEKGVYSWDVFTELASDFFRICSDKEINTVATRRFGDTIDVSLRVQDLRVSENQGSSNSQSNEQKLEKSGNTTLNMQLMELEEAFVILAKNNSAKSISVTNSETVNKVHEFARKFRDHEFRGELKKYCEINKNVENMVFLERVKEYKKAEFGVRVDMKTSIYEQFIKQNAKMQLNLSNEMVVEETIKINKSMGDVDVFKNVEECVLHTLALDIYPRFLANEQRVSVAITE
jgi:CHASE1-domain containing sensor protein